LARRVLGAFAVTATAALATLVLATPASAHIPKWDAKCDEGAKVTKVWVNLNAYADKGNTVVVKDGDKELVNTQFGRDFSKNWDKLDAAVEHTFTIKVTASDGARFNYEDKRTVKPCVKTPPPSTTKPTKPVKPPVPPTVTSPEAPSSSETPPPSTTTTTPAAPAPGGSAPEPPLAATGASPMWLLLSGLGLVGAGAGTLLFMRRRRA